MRHDRGTSLRIDDLIPRMRGTKRPAASVWGSEGGGGRTTVIAILTPI